MIVMTVDTCTGPRAYAGAVFAYHEHLAEGFTRLTDEDWASMLVQDPRPPDVAWMAPIVAEEVHHRGWGATKPERSPGIRNVFRSAERWC